MDVPDKIIFDCLFENSEYDVTGKILNGNFSFQYENVKNGFDRYAEVLEMLGKGKCAEIYNYDPKL